MKSVLASAFVQGLLGRLMGGYMLFVGWTTRWRLIDRPVVEHVWAQGGPVIACIWHGRILLVHKGWFGPGAQPPKMLISNSREGGVVATASRTVGAPAIRGSKAKGAKRKGGFEAMREMLRHLQEAGCMCLTPDGPRGPGMRAQLGPVQLAKLSGAPILCLAWSTRWGKRFASWDQFLLPAPFGRGAFVWGGPIHVAKDADAAALEHARLAVEQELNRITALADQAVGRAFSGPALAESARTLPKTADAAP